MSLNLKCSVFFLFFFNNVKFKENRVRYFVNLYHNLIFEVKLTFKKDLKEI